MAELWAGRKAKLNNLLSGVQLPAGPQPLSDIDEKISNDIIILIVKFCFEISDHRESNRNPHKGIFILQKRPLLAKLFLKLYISNLPPIWQNIST